MKIRSIHIRRMPGFEDEGFDLNDLSDSLNLIIGPNASGKTTACRAVRGLLWPETLAGDRPVSLASQWVDGESAVQLELEGREFYCQRDGVPAVPPPLPPVHLARCFTVTVDDLFEGPEIDGDLAGRVAREMAGGYDLSIVRELDFLKLSRRHAAKEREELLQAKQTAQSFASEQESLQGEEQQLEVLEDQLAGVRLARDRRGLVADAIELISLRAQMAEANEALATFPPDMERLTGSEANTLEQIRGDLYDAVDALKNAEAAASDASAEKSEADLPDGGIAKARLDEHHTRLQTLQRAESELGKAADQLARADGELASAVAAFGPGVDEANLDALNGPQLDEVERFHRAAEKLAAERAGIEGRLVTLGEERPAANTQSIIGGIQTLESWLSAGSDAASSRAPLRPAVWQAVGVLAFLGLVLGLAVSQWLLLGLLPAACVGLWVSWLARPAASAGRSALKEQYARLELEAPAQWDLRSVGQCLQALRQNLVTEEHLRELAQERAARRRDLEQIESRQRDLGAQREDLRARLALECSDLAMVVLAANLKAYRAAKGQRDGYKNQRDKWQKTCLKALEAVNAFLVEFGSPPAESAEVADARSRALFDRAEQYRQAEHDLAEAQKQVRYANQRLETLAGRKKALFDQAGLADDEADLARRLSRLDDFRMVSRNLAALKSQAQPLEARVQQAPELAEMSAEQASEEADRLEAQAGEYDLLLERMTEIRGKVDAAGRSTRLADAVAAITAAEASLAARRAEAELSAAGMFLLDQVEAEHQAESQPRVFRQAAGWFNRFTRGRYRLLIDPADGGAAAFRARDTSTGTGLALEQLSRGTRMQLVLAVRLAFAADSERGTQLPFILDEVLSSTDPLRYQAVAECLLAMVERGRQVFYLTCQPGDAAGWAEVAERMGIADAKRVDLTEVRRLEVATAVPLLEASTATAEPTPAPGEMSMTEYCQLLHAPSLNPAAGAAANHVSYFVDDPAALHLLLRAGIERFGQLRSMAAHGPIDAYVPEGAWPAMAASAEVMDAFAAAWGVGRGRPLTPEALADAGVSDNFIERVKDLARDLAWDARRLVEVLEARDDERAKGFRANVLEAMRGKLAEDGYLDEQPTLNLEQISARVLASANEAVKAGTITPEAVRDKVEHFWAACSQR